LFWVYRYILWHYEDCSKGQCFEPRCGLLFFSPLFFILDLSSPDVYICQFKAFNDKLQNITNYVNKSHKQNNAPIDYTTLALILMSLLIQSVGLSIIFYISNRQWSCFNTSPSNKACLPNMSRARDPYGPLSRMTAILNAWYSKGSIFLSPIFPMQDSPLIVIFSVIYEKMFSNDNPIY